MKMSFVSANDQTSRDRSPVHGLRGFVCFVRVVLLPVSINLCHFNTARAQFYFLCLYHGEKLLQFRFP